MCHTSPFAALLTQLLSPLHIVHSKYMTYYLASASEYFSVFGLLMGLLLASVCSPVMAFTLTAYAAALLASTLLTPYCSCPFHVQSQRWHACSHATQHCLIVCGCRNQSRPGAVRCCEPAGQSWHAQGVQLWVPASNCEQPVHAQEVHRWGQEHACAALHLPDRQGRVHCLYSCQDG